MSRFVSSVDGFARSPLPILVLVVIAGGVDALIALHSKELLAVYMTGNSTKVGQSLVQGTWGKAVPLVCVIACFFASTTCAAWLGARVDKWRAALCLTLCAALLALALPFAGERYALAGVCLIAAGVGALNQARADQPGVSFITGALVNAGRQIAAAKFGAAAVSLSRWIALIAGAVIGTLLDMRFGSGALAILACVAFACAVATALHRNALVHQSSTDGEIAHARK